MFFPRRRNRKFFENPVKDFLIRAVAHTPAHREEAAAQGSPKDLYTKANCMHYILNQTLQNINVLFQRMNK